MRHQGSQQPAQALLLLQLAVIGSTSSPGDWLLSRPGDYPPATVRRHAARDTLTVGNTLIERTFSTAPDFACVSFESLLTEPPTEILRAVGPEALIR